MFVIMGYTRGDELIRSSAKPLFADSNRDVCEEKMADITKERDQWLSVNEVPFYAQCSVFSRFEIVETPF